MPDADIHHARHVPLYKLFLNRAVAKSLAFFVKLPHIIKVLRHVLVVDLIGIRRVEAAPAADQLSGVLAHAEVLVHAVRRVSVAYGKPFVYNIVEFIAGYVADPTSSSSRYTI